MTPLELELERRLFDRCLTVIWPNQRFAGERMIKVGHNTRVGLWLGFGLWSVFMLGLGSGVGVRVRVRFRGTMSNPYPNHSPKRFPYQGWSRSRGFCGSCVGNLRDNGGLGG